MNFSAWSIRNPIAPILAFVLLTVLGWQSFNRLPVTRFPNIDIPLVAVSVAQPGAAPAEIEAQVTKEVEDAVAGIAGVKNVFSSVADGLSTTSIEFRLEVPTDKAVQDVKDAVDRIRSDLPAGIEAPIVTRIDVEGQAIMTFAVGSADMSLEDLSWFVDDKIKRALQGRPGVGRIDRYGGADREIRIELDPMRLNSFGITAAAVNQQVRLTNANLGSGRATLGGSEQAIRVLGDASDAARLAGTTIALSSGRFVKLGELGQVIDTYEEPRSFSRLDGDPVVTFAVFKSKGASEVSVAETVDATLEQVRAANPGVEIRMVDDTVFYTYGNYTSALHTLMEGALLAVLVVFLFLRNWRATLISAMALPLSAIPTFYVMDLMGFSLNLVSFLAITLATGILVDDAIVEIENIARHIRMGKTPYRAAIDAADEIGLAVIATTMTIVAVFVPVSFMPGVPGQYFRQFGLTVAISVLFSLLVARLITPLMAAYLMRAKDAAEHGSHGEGWAMRGYLALMRRSLGHRYLTLLIALAVLAVSVFFMARVPGAFMPPEDVSRISISVELPPGSSLGDTERATDTMQARLAGMKGVQSVFILGGSSPKGDLDVRRASVTLVLERLDHSLLRRISELLARVPVLGRMVPEVEAKGRLRPQNEIEAEAFERLASVPDIRASKLNDRGERDISYSVMSGNEDALNDAVARLEVALRAEPLLANVASEGALPRPEVHVTPRLEEAARLGVTTVAISETVRVATIGDVDAALAKVSLDGRQIPIRVQLEGEIKDDLSRLSALRVPTASGKTVPLSTVADLRLSEGPSFVDRQNRERRATIGANLPVGVPQGTATARFEEIVKATDLPDGVRVIPAGDAEVMKEMNQSFVNAMIMGMMLVLTVLILLFGSILQPFTILFSLPLAIGGVAIALILTGYSVSMPVMIGMLMLMGIVTKNAILLVDFAIEMIAQGKTRVDAMLEAGHKRAQPIVMTSIAMAAGMMPSALGVGEGGAFRAPMATAVIGGIIVSTVLSLVVVPSFFLIMDDLQRGLAWLFRGVVGAKEPEPQATDPLVLTNMVVEGRAEVQALASRVSALEGAVRPPRQGPKIQAAE